MYKIISHFKFGKAVVMGFLMLSMVTPTAMAHDESSVIDKILDDGVLRVGLSSFVPWAMRSNDGELIGFEVDVAKKLAADLDVELELVPTAWDGIIPSLIAKKFDVIISGMYITAARNAQINFTIPYDKNGLDLVANKSLIDAGYNTIEAFNKEDIVFALRRGSFPVTYTKETLPLAQVVQFDDDASARQEVLNGNAHAWITAAPQPAFSAIDYPEQLHQPIKELLTFNQQGMAVRKGDFDTLNFLNNWIRLQHENNFLVERHNYWFGSRDWQHLVTK